MLSKLICHESWLWIHTAYTFPSACEYLSVHSAWTLFSDEQKEYAQALIECTT